MKMHRGARLTTSPERHFDPTCPVTGISMGFAERRTLKSVLVTHAGLQLADN